MRCSISTPEKDFRPMEPVIRRKYDFEEQFSLSQWNPRSLFLRSTFCKYWSEPNLIGSSLLLMPVLLMYFPRSGFFAPARWSFAKSAGRQKCAVVFLRLCPM